MELELAHSEAPDEGQVDAMRAQLEVLEADLSKCELDLLTLQAELGYFQNQYLRTVGPHIAELDAIKARIAAHRARQNPADEVAREQAREAQTEADESAKEAVGDPDRADQTEFAPSADLKMLYRSIAMRVHPDLATDDSDRERRHKYMVEANRAYEMGDEQRLHEILSEWESEARADPEDGLVALLARIILKIAQVQKRILQTAIEAEALRKSKIFVLREKARQAAEENRDVFAEMIADIQAEIAAQMAILAQLQVVVEQTPPQPEPTSKSTTVIADAPIEVPQHGVSVGANGARRDSAVAQEEVASESSFKSLWRKWRKG